ncbi:DUF2066 domain-containing protein [Immundisolibacter sp.]
MVAAPAAVRLTPTMRLMLPLVCVALTLGLCRAAFALDLYQARVPLADASEASRRTAVTEAFGRVLAQVAGRQAAAVLAQQAGGADAAQRSLLSFGGNTGADGVALLEARFDARAVREFLAQRRVAALPDARPTLLLWLLADRDGAPAWVGADDPPDLAVALQQAAGARGLPLLLPALDLTERSQLPASADPADQTNVAGLSTASARYRPDGILFGRLRGGGARWQVDLRLALPGRQDAVWSTSGASAQAAIDAGFDTIGARLVPAGAVADGPPVPVQIAIDGISDIAAYAQVWQHLKQVPGLSGLRPLTLGNGRALFRFELAGGDAALVASVEPGAPFTRVAGDTPAYRYQP